jgi:putative membrane protein
MSGRQLGVRAGGTSAGRTAMARTWRRYCLTTLTMYGFLWLALAIAPRDRADWALENALVVVFVPALVASLRWFPLSRLSWTLILVFLSLHTVGAHYTYAEVPYDAWSLALFGRRLNDLLGLERNHFDRLVHFSYGLLMAYPMRELFLRVADARGFWGYFLPLDLTLSTSATFELLEWAAVEFFGGDLGGRLSGRAGRRLGRAEGHGPGRAGCGDRHDADAPGQPKLAARLQPGVGREPAREAPPAPRRDRAVADGPDGQPVRLTSRRRALTCLGRARMLRRRC